MPVTTIVSYQFQGLNSAVTVNEVSHSHLLCSSKDVFCGRSHYFLHVLLLSIKQKQTWAKLILPPKCEASYIHNAFHSVVSVTFRQWRTVNKIYERSHRFSRELASWWKEGFSSPGHGKVKFTSHVNCWIKHLQKYSFSDGFRKQIMQLDLGLPSTPVSMAMPKSVFLNCTEGSVQIIISITVYYNTTVL